MSHRFSKIRETNNWPIDQETINDNLRPFAEEVGGQLNEHNWAANAISSNSNVTAGAQIRIRSSSQEVNPGIGQASPRPGTLPTDGFKVSGSSQWVVVDDMDLTDEYDDTVVLITASFQIETTNVVIAGLWGFQLAIAVDENIISESIVGSVDKALDNLAEGFMNSQVTMPFVVEVVVPLTAGPHRVSLVARTCRGANLAVPAANVFYMVLNREMIILESW